MKFRKNTYDKKIMEESKKEYRLMSVDSNDVVFDIGAHIGGYTCHIANKVRQVIAFEPDHQNFELLKENTKNLRNVKVFKETVWKDAVGQMNLYRVVKPYKKLLNTGMSSVYPKRGRKKFRGHTVSFQNILNKYKPTKIKCDIEGAEFDIFVEPLKIPQSVREMIMEVHLKDKELKKRFHSMERYIKSQGFTKINKRKTLLSTNTWYGIVHFKRIGFNEQIPK